MEASQLPERLRRELLNYLSATSEKRARLVGELTERNPGIADLLADLEADDTLRDQFELELPAESRNLVARPRYARLVAMLPKMLEDESAAGWLVGRAGGVRDDCR